MAGMSETTKRDAVEPDAVQVGADQRHRDVGAHLIEELALGSIRPERTAKSISDHLRAVTVFVTGDMVREQVRRTSCGIRAREIKTRADLRPLLEVHVVVPQTRQEKPAIEVHGLISTTSVPDGTHGAHPIRDNQNILHRRVASEPRMPEDDTRHPSASMRHINHAPLCAVQSLQTGAVVGISLIALMVTLAASEVLVRGVGRLAGNLGLLGGIVGLIVALCADSPEISSSISAVAGGSAATAAGIVFGSNIFNIAVLLGGAALAAGEVRIPRPALVVDGAIAILVTLSMALVVLDVLAVPVGLVVTVAVFVPYVAFLILRTVTIARLPLPERLSALLVDASREAGIEGMELEAELEDLAPVTRSTNWWPVLLMLPALVVIVVGADLMVQGALTLGTRSGIPSVLIGVVALAAATSLPNAYAAIRLALDGHGAAVVSATFNSNTLNLIAGIAFPVVFFPALRGSVPPGYVVWLLGVSGLALILLGVRLTRRGAVLLLVAYAGFICYAVLTR